MAKSDDMETVKNWIELICLSWVIHSILMRIYAKIEIKAQIKGLRIPYIITCPKCFTFWMILLATLNPLTAAVISAGVAILSGILLQLSKNIPINL